MKFDICLSFLGVQAQNNSGKKSSIEYLKNSMLKYKRTLQENVVLQMVVLLQVPLPLKSTSVYIFL